MSEQKPEFSRVRRKRKNNKANKMLNWMIAVVVLLIVLVGVKILSGGSTPENNEASVTETAPSGDESISDQADLNDDLDKDEADEEDNMDSDDKTSEDEDVPAKEGTVNDESEDEEDTDENAKEERKEGTVTYSASEDAVVDETISNTSWEPVGTTQSGNHVSQYDGKSTDWKEKEKALAYATGLSQNDMIFWKIKNGGSPQKSIGIVSSKNKSEKYRVYLEWVDGEGWKPTQMDVLNTLDFNY